MQIKPSHTDRGPFRLHYLPLNGMVNIPVYLVWEYWVQLNFIAGHTTFNNGCMKSAHTKQRMTNNNNNNKSKQV